MKRVPPPPGAVPGPQRMRGWRLGAPLLGIAWRLGLGLAAVAAVLVGAEVLATRTTRDALEAVRVMQSEHEPLANSADAVLEKLVAYDQAVGAYVQARSGTDVDGITLAGDALEDAVAAYFANRPQAPVTPATAGTAGAADASHRDRAAARRAVPRSAGSGSTRRGRRPSTASTSSSPRPAARASPSMVPRYMRAARSRNCSPAINAVRGNLDKAAVMARREEDFTLAAGPERRGAAGVPRARVAGAVAPGLRRVGAPAT